MQAGSHDREIDDEWVRNVVPTCVQQIDPEYFKSKRWFGNKSATIEGYRVVELEALRAGAVLWCYLLLEILYADAEPQVYQLPLAVKRKEDVPPSIQNEPYGAAFVVGRVDGEIWGYDALAEDSV